MDLELEYSLNGPVAGILLEWTCRKFYAKHKCKMVINNFFDVDQ